MALDANRTRYTAHLAGLVLGSAPAIDDEEYYEGQILMFTPGASTVEPGADTANGRFAGICSRRITTGTGTTERVPFEYGHLEWMPIAANSLAAGDEGLDAVIGDDGTLSEAADTTNDVRVGKVVKFETIGGVAGAWFWAGVHGPAAA